MNQPPGFRLLHVCTVPQTLNFLDRQVAYTQVQGCEVHAVASDGQPLDAFAARTGATVHAVAMSRRITPLRDLWSLARLIRVLWRVRPDIVHGHTPKGGLLAMLAAWVCRVPVRVYHLHGLPMMTATGAKRRLLRWCEMVSCRLAHRVFAVSASLREVALAEGLCGPDKLTVLLNGTLDGVDAEEAFNPAQMEPDTRAAVRREYGIPPAALVVGFAGRLVRDKGVSELAQAWELLRAEFPELHLLVVGPTEPHDPPPPSVQELLRAERVHATGEIPVQGMARIYRAMDILALPTYREGFNTVLLEAGAMELPVVATRIPGCVDGVRDGETGTLVPVRDAAALAEALRVYLRDAELRRRHGAAGRALVLRSFQPPALGAALYREYLRLLDPVEPALPRSEIADSTGSRVRQNAGNVGSAGSRVRQNAGDAHPRSGERGYLRGDAEPRSGERGYLRDQRSPEYAGFYRRRGKRLLDLALSATALVLLTPVLLILAILVRCFLGTPVLFRQRRTGFRLRPFTIWKFRTMTDARDASGELLPDSERLTRFGRFLRATSLDELPEFWNVLRGDMSLVGPRPLLPRYDAYYSEIELRRFDLLPGITGWAQINGRNDLAWDNRLACDVWYAGACSFGLDLRILFLTAIKVVRRDNVQPDPGATLVALDEERPRRLPQLCEMSEGGRP